MINPTFFLLLLSQLYIVGADYNPYTPPLPPQPKCNQGFNCNGGNKCQFFNNALSSMNDAVQNIKNDTQFKPGQQIVTIKQTAGKLACFVECNPDPNFRLSGENFKDLYNQLENECGNCGSIPLFYPNPNDASKGLLTCNEVSE